MNAAATIILATLLLSELSPGQVSPDTLLHAPPATTDTLQTDSVRPALPRQDEIRIVPQFLGDDKAEIEETRIFDVRTLPMVPGEREPVTVELGRFDKPQNMFVLPPPPRLGRVAFSYGSFSTWKSDAVLQAASSSADLLLRGAYISTQGKLPHQDFRQGNVMLDAGILLPENDGIFSLGALRGAAELDRARYKLYGSTSPGTVRSLHSFRGRTGVRMKYGDEGFLSARLQLGNASLMDSLATHETTAGVEIGGGMSIDKMFVTAELGVWRNALKSSFTLHDPEYASFNVGFEYRPGGTIRLLGGVKAFHARGSDSDARQLFFPSAGFRWFAAEGITVHGLYAPAVERASLAELLKANPYLTHDTRIDHTEYFQRIILGVDVALTGLLKAKMLFVHERAHRYPIFSPTQQNLWRVEYSGTSRLLIFETGVFLETRILDAGLSVTLQEGKLRDGTGITTTSDADIPYFPNVRLSGVVRHRFAFGMIAGSRVKFVGSRERSVTNSGRLPSFVSWDLDLGFPLRPFTAGVLVENILNQQQMMWDAYTGEPRRVMLTAELTF